MVVEWYILTLIYSNKCTSGRLPLTLEIESAQRQNMAPSKKKRELHVVVFNLNLKEKFILDILKNSFAAVITL